MFILPTALLWPVLVSGGWGTEHHFAQVHMGLRVDVTVYTESTQAAEDAARAAFRRFAELDATFSDYRKDSEASLLMAQAGKGPQLASPDMVRVLRMAERVSRASDGAFDVTVGPLTQLWRQSRKTLKLPAPEVLAAAQALVGYQHVHVTDTTVALDLPGMKLDFGGIAKGYACQEAMRAMRREGVYQALVVAGGDMAIGEPPPGRKGWRVEIVGRPGYIELAECAVSTSGSTEQYVEIGGVRYSHIVDPRTGLGVRHRTQATIIASSGLTTDPLSKVVCLLGKTKGAAIARRFGAQASAIERRDSD
ncbi:MAG: FAD:protein FMN transferase [Armatimonadetes bacterium]|nr:FAD:protein FMN transferase [Armatimonadota bacterium]